jgi:hypothetical protein
MKINYLLIAIFCIGIFSCSEEELEDLTYPRKFVYAGLEYHTEGNYQITENGFEDVDAPPIRDTIEDIIIKDAVESPDLGINQMVVDILSDSELRLYWPIEDTIDLNLTYELLNNTIIISDERFIDTLATGTESLLPLTTNDSFTQVEIAFDCYISNSYNSFRGERQWNSGRIYTGFFDPERKYARSTEQLLEDIRDERSLAVSDTILIWRGNFVYEIE